jgi:hygromycin-B 7''-O-kinase
VRGPGSFVSCIAAILVTDGRCSVGVAVSLMHALPDLINVETFHAWRADRSRWLPIAADIARGHSLSSSHLHVFSTGTNLVVALDHMRVLKIYPPMLRHQFVSERACLSQLYGRLSIAIPEIVLEGERDRWPYLVMTRLTGVGGNEIWSELAEDEKERVLYQLGELIAEVQRAPVGGLSGLEPRWEQFIPRQIEGCRARHERLGLPRNYLDELEDFIRGAARLIPMKPSEVILTGEYNQENLFLVNESEGWRLSGLIDFGDVMTGWGEYDLMGPSTFMTAGMPGRVASLFRGFGYSSGEINPALGRRLMALCLLHRFSNLKLQICIDSWQQKATNLGELQRLLWPIC